MMLCRPRRPHRDGAHCLHDDADPVGDDVHGVRRPRQPNRRGRHRGRHSRRVGVENGVEGPHPLGDYVSPSRATSTTSLACTQVSELGTDEVPMRLLAVQVQLDQVNEHLLQVLHQDVG